MGWTGTRAVYYYKNGTVNRKKECDEYLNTCLDGYELMRSTMRGTTYYAAIRKIKDEKQPVTGVVILTRVDNSEGLNFFYKVITENMEPAETKCPDSILDLLTEPESDITRDWRKTCREYNQQKRVLAGFHMGTQITVICSGKKYLLTKSVLRGHSTPQWICWPERTKFRVDDIIRLGFEKHRLDTSEITSA